MTWHLPALFALVLLALALVVAKVAAGSVVFEGRSLLIVVAMGAAAWVALRIPERQP